MARGRRGDVYGINGEDRGFRWDCASASLEQIGITAPASAPVVTVDTNSPLFYIAGVNILDGGYGYDTPPAVTFSGGGGSGAAARAEIRNGTVSNIVMTSYGSGYSSAPTVSIAAPAGSGDAGSAATLVVSAKGKIRNVWIKNRGSGYTSTPSVTVSGGSPTTAAELEAVLNGDGEVASINVLFPGEGYTSDPTITISGGSGSGATAELNMDYAVDAVTVSAGGSGWGSNPAVVFAGGGTRAGGAVAEATINSSGEITAVSVISGGSYLSPPTAAISARARGVPTPARASVSRRPAISGKYWCAIRYVDDTTPTPIPSSISEITEVDATATAGALSWSWSNTGMESRVDKIELWRTTADQALVLYRVATLAKTATSYTDTVGDSELISPTRQQSGSDIFGAMPIVLPTGQVNARRFNPPPRNKRVIVMFQDRAWYGVDVPGREFDYTLSAGHAEPNSLYFSEIDEPESVPETNELIIQNNSKGQDQITALMPFGGGLVVFQTRHAYRLAYAAQPIIDASVELLTQRGCLNQRCWDLREGVAYIADSSGIYSLSGAQVTPLSSPVRKYWSEGVIDFSGSKWFFLRVDPVSGIVRFHFSVDGGFPDRALCYHPTTTAWWEEQYAQRFGGADCLTIDYAPRLVVGGAGGNLYEFDTGHQDRTSAEAAAGITCYLRTGNMALATEQDRHIRVLYEPTSTETLLNLALHYNGSSTPRQAAVSTDRGSGFTTTAGGPATLNLASGRSPLGDATGYAVCYYSGHLTDRSAGGDRHLAIALSATRPSADSLTLYAAAVSGVS